MRSTIAVVFLALSGCATVPSHEHDEAAQRYKEGSIYHAYGAPLVITGLLTAATAGVLLATDADLGSLSNEPPPVMLIGVAVGLAEMLIGGLLVSNGNAMFTPESRTYIEPETKDPAELERRIEQAKRRERAMRKKLEALTSSTAR